MWCRGGHGTPVARCVAARVQIGYWGVSGLPACGAVAVTSGSTVPKVRRMRARTFPGSPEHTDLSRKRLVILASGGVQLVRLQAQKNPPGRGFSRHDLPVSPKVTWLRSRRGLLLPSLKRQIFSHYSCFVNTFLGGTFLGAWRARALSVATGLLRRAWP